MGLEASTCPSMGLSQQGKTAHLQAGWAGRVPAQGQGWPTGGVQRAQLAPSWGGKRPLRLRRAGHRARGLRFHGLISLQISLPRGRNISQDSISWSLFGENAFLTANSSQAVASSPSSGGREPRAGHPGVALAARATGPGRWRFRVLCSWGSSPEEEEVAAGTGNQRWKRVAEGEGPS